MWNVCDRTSLSSQWGLTVLAVGLSLSSCNLTSTQANDRPIQKQTVGWIEEARILGVGSDTEVKLDTGATTTSINAEILEKPEGGYEAGGMVKFRFLDTDGDNKIYELPVARWVRIKDGKGGYFRRPVVRMQICVAGQWIEEEVNLADREQFDYSVLIGRNMLEKGGLVVDSAATRTTKPNCPEREEVQ